MPGVFAGHSYAQSKAAVYVFNQGHNVTTRVALDATAVDFDGVHASALPGALGL